MNEIAIWHHLGMGDMVTCNAIVRNYAKKYDKVYLFTKRVCYPSTKFLYRDLKNVELVVGGKNVFDDSWADRWLQWHPAIKLLKIGFNYLTTHPHLNFDQAFYQQAGIPFQKKFDDFYVERDMNREEELLKRLNPTGEPYVFVHQDKLRDYVMNLDHIKNKELKVIEPTPKYLDKGTYHDDIDLIFDYMKLIENAEEVHVMESSFKCLIDGFIKDKPNVFYHRYMRDAITIGRPYWIILNKREVE